MTKATQLGKSCLPSIKRDVFASLSLMGPSSQLSNLMSNSFYLVVLEGPVDLLDVGEDNFWVESSRADHLVHVVPGDEVRDPG